MKTFNLIKLSILKKKYINIVPLNKKSLTLMKLFLKYNIILGYKYVSIDEKLFIKYFINSKINHHNLKNLCKISNPRYVKYSFLKKNINRYTYSNYILSSSKGLIDLKEAYSKKIGGILLFKLN